MWYKSNIPFSLKLHQLIEAIKKNKHIKIKDIEEALANATGMSIYTVQAWHLRGEIPKDRSTLEDLAHALYELCKPDERAPNGVEGFLKREEIEEFLTLGGHPNPEAVPLEAPTTARYNRAMAYETLEEVLPEIQEIVNIEGPEDYVNGWPAISRYDKMDPLWCNIQPYMQTLLGRDTACTSPKTQKRLPMARYSLLKLTFLSPHFLHQRGENQLRINLATYVIPFAQAEQLTNYLAWMNADIIPWPILLIDPTPAQLRIARSVLLEALESSTQNLNISAQANALFAKTYLLDRSMRFSERIHRAAQSIKEALSLSVALGVRANVLRCAGDLYYEQQKYDEAIHYYEESYWVDLEATRGKYPTIVGNQVRLVETYLASMKISEAQTAMQRLRNRTPAFCYGPFETKWLKQAQAQLAKIEGDKEAAKRLTEEAAAASAKLKLTLPMTY